MPLTDIIIWYISEMADVCDIRSNIISGITKIQAEYSNLVYIYSIPISGM
jgi:hypothetical protein